MIKIDENDPVGEVDPSFPFRDVVIKKNTDMKQFYDLQKEIGRGKFGTVYRCTEKITGLKLAAKFINTSKRQDRRNAEREVEIMKELQHPRLIQIYDAYEIHNTMCVILELIEGGELFERVIDDDFILTEKSVSVFMKQICEGVAFIHSKNVLHLDMKPENILCLSRNGNRIKIIDFGLARKYDPEKKMQVLFGTPEFVAPEVVNFESIGYGTDMWSVGVICYVLLSGLSPFMGETDVQTMANVTIAQYDFEDEAFNDISKDAKDFIAKLLVKDREVRMSATDCLSHDWLRRRNTESSCNDLVSQERQTNANNQRSNELEYQKDTLRNIVDRWNDDAHLIAVPTAANGECIKVSKSDKSKLTDANADNIEMKTNQPGRKPKTKIIIKTKKIKKKDASRIVPDEESSATKLTPGKVAVSSNLVKSAKTDEVLVNEMNRALVGETVISNGVEKAVPASAVKSGGKDKQHIRRNLVTVPHPTITEKKENVVPMNAKPIVDKVEVTNIEDKKQLPDIRTTTDTMTAKKPLQNSQDRSHAQVDGAASPETKTGQPRAITPPERDDTESSIAFKKSTQCSVTSNVPKTSLVNNSNGNVQKVRKSPVRKTPSSEGKKKKIISKTTSPQLFRKIETGSGSEVSPTENLLAAKLPNEVGEKQPNKFVTTITETVKSIFTRSTSKEGNGTESKPASCDKKASDLDHGKSIQVEVSDESYKSIKKCTFIIKNIKENKGVDEGHKEANASAQNSASVSDEEVEPMSNLALRRRISDITSLLSRGGHTNKSADEIANLRHNLNQLLQHTRPESLSKSLSCGESGSFISKRPKFRISYFSRDVPISNAMTNCHNFTNLISQPLNGEDGRMHLPNHKMANHSDPGSLRTSPEPFGPPSLSRKQLSRFFSDSMDYDLPSAVSSSSPNSMTKDELTELIS